MAPAFQFKAAPHVAKFWRNKNGANKINILDDDMFDWLQNDPYMVDPRNQQGLTTCRIYSGMAVIDIHRHLFLGEKNQQGVINGDQLEADFGTEITESKVPTEEQTQAELKKELKKIKGAKYHLWEHPYVPRPHTNSVLYEITPDIVRWMILEFGPFSGSVLLDQAWKDHTLTVRPEVVDPYAGFMGFFHSLPGSPTHSVVITGWENRNNVMYIRVRDSRGSQWGHQGVALAACDRKVAEFEFGILADKRNQ